MRFGLVLAALMIVTSASAFQGELNFTFSETEVCSGTKGVVHFTSSGVTFQPGNVFSVEFSNNFASGLGYAGILTSTATNGDINVTIPDFPAGGSGFRLRLRSSAPELVKIGADEFTVPPSVVPEVTLTPSNDHPCSGNAVTFTAAIINGGDTPDIIWEYNGYVYQHGGVTLDVPSVEDGDQAIVRVKSSAECATIDYTVKTYVIHAPRKPDVTIDPGVSVCGDGPITIAATSSDVDGSRSFQWYRNNHQVGVNSDTYVENNSGPYYFNVVMTYDDSQCGPGSVTSDAQWLGKLSTINPEAKFLMPEVVCNTGPTTFTNLSTTAGTFTYYWYKNDVDVSHDVNYTDSHLVPGDKIQLGISQTYQCQDTHVSESEVFIVPELTSPRTPEVDVDVFPNTNPKPGETIVFNARSELAGTFLWWINNVPQFIYDGYYPYSFNSFSLKARKGDVVQLRAVSSKPCLTSKEAAFDYYVSPDSTVTMSSHKWEEIGVDNSEARVTVNPSGFMIGDMAYAGTGRRAVGSAQPITPEFFEYNYATNKWIQPGNRPQAAEFTTAFAIGNKGYIGLGGTPFYSFEPGVGWQLIAEFPGENRKSAVGFAIGDKGYVGLGVSTSSSNLYADFWEYNPANNSWKQLSDFPGIARSGTFSFVINGKAYVGGGNSAAGALDDIWEYNPSTDTWTKKAKMPDKRRFASSFVIHNIAFVGFGKDNLYTKSEFWTYNPLTDSWKAVTGLFPERWYETQMPAFSYQHHAVIKTANTAFEFSPFSMPQFKMNIEAEKSTPIPFESDIPFSNGNVFTVEISDTPGFVSSQVVGTLSSSASTGNVNVSIPPGAVGKKYIRIRSSNPELWTYGEEINVSLVTGLDPIEASVNAYPNPFSNSFEIQLPKGFIYDGCSFTIMNELGQTVHANNNPLPINKVEVNGSPGIYLLKVNAGDKIITKKLVKLN